MITTTVIIFLVGLLIVSGTGESQVHVVENSIDVYEKAIKRDIKDDAREDRALAEIETVRNEFEVQAQQFGDATSAYIEVDNRHETTLEQYSTTLDELLGAWEQFERWTIDKHYSIRKHFTDDEWPEAMERVNKDTQNLLKDFDKKISKIDKKHKKNIAKYEKKHGKVYKKPGP